MAEGFLGIDSILNIYINVTNGLVVYPKMVERRIMNELPFIASENILMDAVKKGGDRQELHELIREHSIAAGKRVKEEGLDNDMIERIAADSRFGLSRDEIVTNLDPNNYTGRSEHQVEKFIREVVDPLLVDAEVSEGEELKV